MRRGVLQKTVHIMLILSVIFGLMVTPCLSDTHDVYADNDIVVTLESNDTTVYPGDIVTINVHASELHNITRFGQIDLRFPQDKAEFISLWQPTELSTFVYTYDNYEEGHLNVFAIDEVVESDLDMGGEDQSIYFDEDIVLFSASFRVNSDSVGSLRFWLDVADGFRDSSGEETSASIGDGITINVEDAISSDTRLVQLTLDGVSLTPEFSPDVYEYTTNVSSQVTEIDVTVSTSNLNAVASIQGNDNLQLGENIITVTVTAQDGVSVSEYKVYVSRQESIFTEGSSLVDSSGRTFTFVTAPALYDLPEGFVSATRTINGYTVPVYVKEGVTSYLIYVYDGVGEPGYYFYNPTTKVITRYNSDNYAIISSRVLNVVPVPDAVKIPSGFEPSTLMTADGILLEGYVNENNVFIAYMKDEDGNSSFYRYDSQSGKFYDYKTVDKTAERIYGIFFRVFLIISLVEAIVIIATVYLIRRIIANRNNPRPRRV